MADYALTVMPFAIDSAGIENGAIGCQGKDCHIPACPYTWAKPMHRLNCDVVWPKNYTGNERPHVELDTPEYMGPIVNGHVMERLMAMAGLRLASVLNALFGDAAEGTTGLYFGE